LLQYKAQQGVKVYVLLFAEASTVIALGSALVKATLEDLDDNIKVLCHGPPVANMLFSHHQKTVVVSGAFFSPTLLISALYICITLSVKLFIIFGVCFYNYEGPTLSMDNFMIFVILSFTFA
jgi:hypothetical protein